MVTSMDDLVSVIMPAYNAQEHIVDAIQSVRRQTYTNWELLVVDDGSTDGTTAITDSFAARDARVRYFQTSQNRGPAAARNVGTGAARGRYIAFLDSDDLWDAHKLETQLSAVERAQAAFCYSSYRIMAGGVVRERPFLAPATVTYRQMLRGSAIGCLTVLYDAALLGKRYFHSAGSALAGSWCGLLLDKVAHEDYAAWLAILKELEARRMPAPVGVAEPLATYRLTAQSFSSRKWKMALSQWLIYRHCEQLGLRESLGNFLHYAWRGLGKYQDFPDLSLLPAMAQAKAAAARQRPGGAQ